MFVLKEFGNYKKAFSNPSNDKLYFNFFEKEVL